MISKVKIFTEQLAGITFNVSLICSEVQKYHLVIDAIIKDDTDTLTILKDYGVSSIFVWNQKDKKPLQLVAEELWHKHVKYTALNAVRDVCFATLCRTDTYRSIIAAVEDYYVDKEQGVGVICAK